jgi:hypothetical protein
MFFDPTSTDDNKQFNAWVGDEGLQQLNAMNQEYVNNVLGPTIRKVHAIPSSVVGGLEGMARSRDPKRQAFALNTLAQFEDWEPAAYEKLSSQTQSDVNLWRRWKDVLPQDELFREINGGIDSAQRQAKAAYREEADKVLSDPKNPNFTSMESLVDEFDGWFSSTPETPNIWFAARGVMNDYQETFRNEYVRNNGNVEAAKASAIKQVKSRWSVTGIGGQSTLTRNAPEKYYPTFLGEHKWMEDQARLDNGFAPTEKFQLIADDNTQKEIDAGQSPSYLMVKQGPDGVWREVTNKDGKLVRQYFEMPEGLKEVDILDQKIDELRYDLTHFNLGEDNVLDASDERRAELREQRKVKQLRLQELEAEFETRHKEEALSDSAFNIMTEGSTFDQIKKKVIDLNENTSFIPVNMKVFASSLFGSKADITQDDFSGEDKALLTEAVQRVAAKTGEKEGVIGYGDYDKSGRVTNIDGGTTTIGTALADSFTDPAFRMESTLGMARYKIDNNGVITITDLYDFNAKRTQVDKYVKDKGGKISAIVSALGENGLVGMLNAMGNMAVPEGEGRKVKIKLGKIDAAP